MNPYVLLAAVLALIGAAGGGYAWGSHAESNAIEAQQARDEKVRQEVEAAAQRGAANAIAQIEIKHTTVRQPIEREVRESTVYRDCVAADDSLLKLVNETRTRATDSARDRVLPGPSADSAGR